MTTLPFAKYRAAVFFTLALVMIAVGIIVWWRFPGSTLTAQERMEDLCASVVYPDSYDMIDRVTHSRGGGDAGVATFDVRGNGPDQHWIVSRDGTLFYEAIFIYPDGGSAGDSGRSAPAVPTAYVREYSGGEWGDWDATVGETTARGGGTASSSARSSSSTETDDDGSFCGLALEIPGFEVEFRYVGEETIDGVRTHHYFHSYSPGGEGDYISTEHWLDSTGMLKRIREIRYGPAVPGSPESRTEHLKTFSNWGEENIITAPVLTTPEPAPESTLEPALGPTLEPTPEPTLEVTPEPTPEPTTIPATVDAWLEPDPETVTFDGGQWRQFTLRGTGLERVDLAINVSNPDGPSSTGAVELECRITQNTADAQRRLRENLFLRLHRERRLHIQPRGLPGGNGDPAAC